MKSAWTAVWLIVLSLGLAAGGAYLVYKHRLRVSFSLLWFAFFVLWPEMSLDLNTVARGNVFFCFDCLVLQQYMDSEIRAIMAQYMPLDNQPEVPNHVNDERAWESGTVPPIYSSLWPLMPMYLCNLPNSVFAETGLEIFNGFLLFVTHTRVSYLLFSLVSMGLVYYGNFYLASWN